MWEADVEERIINIVSMGSHENFNFKRKHNKNDAIEKSVVARKYDKNYQENVEINERRGKLEYQ
ncbi:MAG: hypothetical protein K940chlam7_02147 [Chlamydiae bacterium]|nr:hypothetical protein [Chlamydiota bacterium]